MKIERLDFRELAVGGAVEGAAAGSRLFMPSRAKQEEPPPPPPPPTFSEAEMEAAEREGYKKGFLAGEQEGRKQMESIQAGINERLVGMMGSFVSSVSPIFEHYRETLLQLQADMPRAALAIARKVAGDAIDRNAATIISDVAMRSCAQLVHEPELTIVAHESLADTLERQLQELASRLPAATQIVIVRDPAMPISDCRIEWRNGSLARITEELWQNLETAISNIQLIGARDAHARMDVLQAHVQSGATPTNTAKE
jgi:flagellar assembly protein FliH